MNNNPFPIIEEPELKRPIVIIDFDGTLNKPENLSARFDWSNFEVCKKIMELHPPDWRMISLINCLFSTLSEQVLFVVLTGRPEPYREVSQIWLQNCKVRYHLLTMKPYECHDSDATWKASKVEEFRKKGHEIWFAIEDRTSVVEAFRALDILTLQCQKGDY